MTDLTPLSGRRYELRGLLGVGGMATVYSGWDTMLHVERAIKVLNPNLNKSATIQQRFLTEARTMARLQHPHIVQVVDVGVDGARTFMVMELLEGGSLHDQLQRNGPQPPHAAGAVALAMLDALSVAHAAGIIHRDIKPQNILLARDGKPKLADFGIAHLTDATRQLTKTGAVMGTIGFMAPEQRISARKVDGRADLYAVGTTLYANLTSQMPIELYASAFDDELMLGIPQALVPIIQTATRYQPAERYLDAAEMSLAPRLALQQIPLEAPAMLPSPPTSGATMCVDDLDDGDDLDDLDDPAPGSGAALHASSAAEPVALPVEAMADPLGPPLWTGGTTADPVRPPGGTLDLSAGIDEDPPRRSRAPLFLGVVALLIGVGVAALAAGLYASSVRSEPETVVAEVTPGSEAETEAASKPVPETSAKSPTASKTTSSRTTTPAPPPVEEIADAEPVSSAPVSANSLDGIWEGTCGGRGLTLDLNFMEGNIVGGSSSLYLAGVEMNVPVSGTYRLDGEGNGRIALTGKRRISGTVTLKGDITSAKSMSGTMLVGQSARGGWTAEQR